MSVISKDLTIVGSALRIVSMGELVIEGSVAGDVFGEEIKIGPEAVVSGGVNARNVTVDGTVSGKITAISVALNPTANVSAEIYHNSLTIHAGAMFEGQSRRSDDKTVLTPDLQQAAS